MKTSEEFIHAVYSLSASQAQYNDWTDRVAGKLKDFLAVLEEYE